MEEAKILEIALKNCYLLEEMLKESIQTVRKLNVRYNIDWLVHNYSDYVNSIMEHYESDYESPKVDILSSKDCWSSTRRSIDCMSTVSEITSKSRRHTFSDVISTSSKTSAITTTTLSRVYRDKFFYSDFDQSRNKINFSVIKIKRNLETILMQLQRAIDIANRQSKFTHHSYRKGKEFICCH